MPVRITRFQPTSRERVEELRRSKGRRTGDPGMDELLDVLEMGEPQEIPVEEGQNARGVRIAIARAANKRGLSVETYESQNEEGTPVIVVAKSEEPPKPKVQAQPSGNGRRRGRPRKQDGTARLEGEAY